jgi:predicted HTH domain antitoxin
MARKRVEIDDHPQLPGTEDERDDTLIRAAKRYQSNLATLKEASSDLQVSHDALKELMHKKGITKYRYKKLQIVLDLSEKCKVKNVDEEPPENGKPEESEE